jgi:hypothetical protein
MVAQSLFVRREDETMSKYEIRDLPADARVGRYRVLGQLEPGRMHRRFPLSARRMMLRFTWLLLERVVCWSCGSETASDG